MLISMRCSIIVSASSGVNLVRCASASAIFSFFIVVILVVAPAAGSAAHGDGTLFGDGYDFLGAGAEATALGGVVVTLGLWAGADEDGHVASLCAGGAVDGDGCRHERGQEDSQE